MNRARALAPAKINVGLAVGERRSDGFHEISTTMLALDWADEVEVRLEACGSGPAPRVEVDGPAASADVPKDERNSAVRAALGALALPLAGIATAPPGALHLRLTKNVPSQAGLGGGSADAAAALLATLAARGAGELGPADQGAALALLGAISSDAPFFLAAALTGAGSCSGRGEVVRELAPPAPPWFVALVVPAVGAPTAAIYAALARERSSPEAAKSLPERARGSTFRDVPTSLTAESARSWTLNHLERYALNTIPRLAEWRDVLDGCGCEHFRLSGSGSAFYGLFAHEGEGRRALDGVLRAARGRSLAWRDARVVRSAGHGARLVSLEG